MNQNKKILLLDHNDLSRRNLYEKLKNLGYQTILEASDDLESVFMTHTDFFPDLIIFHMPTVQTSNPEIFKKIRYYNINIFYILLSINKIFDYTYDAVEYYAVYSLFNTPDDSTIMQHVKIMLEKNSLCEQLKNIKGNNKGQYMNSARRHQLMQLIFQHSSDSAFPERLKTEFAFNYDAFAIIVFQKSTLPDFNFFFCDNTDTNLKLFVIENIAQEMLDSHDIICYSFDSRNDLCLLCNIPDEYITFDESKQKLIKILDKINLFYKVHFDASLTMGVGFAKKYTELKQAFETALYNIERQMENELKNFKMISTKKKLILTERQKEVLKQSLKNSDKKIFYQCLENIYHPFFNTYLLQKNTVNHITLQLILFFLEYILESNPSKSAVFGDEFSLYNEFSALKNAKDTLIWIQQKAEICMRIAKIDHHGNGRNSNSSFHGQILNYMENNYHKYIMMTDIAEYFHFSPGYFCSLFKQTFGISFIKYLNAFRINKAKQLLITSDLKVYKISRKAGFNDVKNFHKIFLKNTGMTPLAYRDYFE